MTFYGSTREDIKKAIDTIHKRAQEAKNNPSSWRKLIKDENANEFYWEDKNGNRIPFLEFKNQK